MYGGVGSNARVAFRKRMAANAAFNAKKLENNTLKQMYSMGNNAAANAKAASNVKAANKMATAVGSLFSAAENTQTAVKQIAQNGPSNMSSVPTNKAKNLLNLANRANALARNLRSMTGGKRRTRRRRN